MIQNFGIVEVSNPQINIWLATVALRPPTRHRCGPGSIPGGDNGCFTTGWRELWSSLFTIYLFFDLYAGTSKAQEKRERRALRNMKFLLFVTLFTLRIPNPDPSTDPNKSGSETLVMRDSIYTRKILAMPPSCSINSMQCISTHLY